MLSSNGLDRLCRGHIAVSGTGVCINRRGLGPFTLPEIVLYIVSAIAMLVFILVLMGYAGNTVPKMVVSNEKQMLTNQVADALINLPNWDGECGCLAKSTITPQGEVIYPGLIPEWKLDEMASSTCIEKHFCTIPYFVDRTESVYTYIWVKDLENGDDWAIQPAIHDVKGPRISRLVGIEYSNGIVHAGKMTVQLWYDAWD